ncbi:MAG: glycosylhydrolase-like jelly roll fold domain-containing protein [Gemmatimonadaceae bacterium]
MWSETTVDGGALVDINLPRPFAKLDYYRDAYVVAFPSLAGDVQGARLLSATMNGGAADARVLTDWDLGTATDGRRRRIMLDLGRVEVLADVLVNGRAVGSVGKPPYRVDITSAVRPGHNAIEVRTTNLWPNRLIGDEELPEEYAFGPATTVATTPAVGGSTHGAQNGIRAIPAWYIQGRPKPAGPRITFTTWKHHRRGAPLLASGLLGPVRVFTGEEIALPR